VASSLFSIVVWLEIVLAAYGLGRPLLRALVIDGEDGLVGCSVWSLGLGFLVAGTLWGALGVIGWLYWPVVAVVTLAASFAGLGQLLLEFGPALAWSPGYEEPEQQTQSSESACRPPAHELTRMLWCLGGLAAFGALVRALAPPTAGDALCYHLELPKIFLAVHAVKFLPYHETSTYPLLAEMWYLWALVVGDGVTAQLVHWLMGLLLAGGTYLLAASILPPAWARWAGALTLLVPGITNQMGTPLNDVALAAYTTLALAAWKRTRAGELGYRGDVAVGLLLGGALAIKYHALLWVACLAIVTLWQCLARRDSLRSFTLRAATVAIVAISVCGMWYLRAAVYRGNPVYPFFSQYVGEPGPKDALDASKRALGFGPLDVASAPWQVTMAPERFGGRGHRLGVVFLMMASMWVVARRLRGLNELLAVGALFAVGWYAMRQNVRFLYPVVPILAVACVWWWIELRRFPRLPRYVAMSLCAVPLLAAAATPAYRARGQYQVACGLESREDYLMRNEPTFAAATVANSLMGGEGRLLSQEYRAYYFNCEVVRETALRQATNYDKKVNGSAELAEHLKQSGFSYVLLADNVAPQGIHYNQTLNRLAEDKHTGEDASMDCLLRYRFADADGGLREYRLMRLR